MKHSKYLRQISCFALLSMLSATVFAEMYKWVDENGEVHYSDKQPAAEVETETIKPPPEADVEQARKELEARQSRYKTEESEKPAEEEKVSEEELAVKKRNCELGRDKLQRLVDNPRVYSTAEDGSRTRLGEDERQARIKEAREMIKTNCN